MSAHNTLKRWHNDALAIFRKPRHSIYRLLTLLSVGSLTLLVGAEINSQKMHDVMQQRYGAEGVAVLGAWSRMLDVHRQADNNEKILRVNDFFNRHVRYAEDALLWQTSDYWATPLETLGMGAGDCEDFTIAKYMSLLELGIPSEQLRLIYVRAQIGGLHSRHFQAHMVLGYYPEPNAVPLILDNLTSTIEPATNRPDLHPVFSFNSEGLWIGNSTESQADPTARLSRWRDVLSRAREEGM